LKLNRELIAAPALAAAFVFFAPAGPAAAPPPSPATVLSHNIRISLDPGCHCVTGTDTVRLSGGAGEAILLLRSGSSLDRALMDAREVEFTTRKAPSDPENLNEIRLALPRPVRGDESPVEIELHFHGAFTDSKKASGFIKRGVAYVEDGVVDAKGVFLPSESYWYPQSAEGQTAFEVHATAPPGWTSVSEGEWVSHSDDGRRAVDGWKTNHPTDAVSLVSGNYRVRGSRAGAIETYTFFYNDDEALSTLYLERTAEYLRLYAPLLGEYPFTKFAVVEGFLPTGYGMPSFTLLGSAILRLPFIPETSLGHEIAHSWWGNSLYVDESRGNWAEAITTYTADYLFARHESADKAAAFRLDKLTGYRNFARESKIALSEFTDATTTESRAVGYNKGMMVFKMLEDLIGTEAFNDGLARLVRSRSFKPTTWDHIEAAFEAASGRGLKWFFEQWIERAGAPSLRLEDARAHTDGAAPYVSFRISQTQKAAPYSLRLPVEVELRDGHVVSRVVELEGRSREFSVPLPSPPASVEIDPEYETFRLLGPGEPAPSLASLLGDREAIIVIPDAGAAREAYLEVGEGLAEDFGLKVVDANAAAGVQYASRPLFLFGSPDENPLTRDALKYLPSGVSIDADSFTAGGVRYPLEENVVALAARDPRMPARTICFFMGKTGADRLRAEGARLRYLANNSYIVFMEGTGPDGRGRLVKGSLPGIKTLRYEFSPARSEHNR